MKSLKQTLIERDGITPAQADAMIADAKERVLSGEDPEEILHSEFGLEPDYMFDLLEF